MSAGHRESLAVTGALIFLAEQDEEKVRRALKCWDMRGTLR